MTHLHRESPVSHPYGGQLLVCNIMANVFERTGLYYINAYGSEIHPSPNPDYIAHLGMKDVLVYSCGSLWTRYALPHHSLEHNPNHIPSQYRPMLGSAWCCKCHCAIEVTSSENTPSLVIKSSSQIPTHLANTRISLQLTLRMTEKPMGILRQIILCPYSHLHYQ